MATFFTSFTSKVIAATIICTTAISGFNGLANESDVITLANRKQDLTQQLASQFEINRLNTQNFNTKLPITPSRAVSNDAELLIEEDFSLFTDGDESKDELGTHITEGYFTSGDPYIPNQYTHTEGWWGVGVYSAGGACALAYPNYGGCITTPSGDYYGNLHITVRCKARPGNNTSDAILMITPAYGDIMAPTMSYTFEYITPTEEWQEYYFNIPNPHIGDDSFIQFNSVCYAPTGIIIDDIKITRDYNFCLTPTNVQSFDFTTDGFTAYWQAGAENKEYLFTLIEEKQTSNDYQEYSEPFEGLTETDGIIDATSIPSGWSFKNIKIANGESKGLSLTAGSEFSLPLNYAYITDLQFDITPVNITEDDKIEIYGYDGISWEHVGSINLQIIQNEGETTLIFGDAADALLGSFKGFSFRTDCAEGSEIIIDNVQWITYGAYERTILKDDEVITTNKYVLTGLNHQNEYYFQVKGRNGEIVSEPTMLTHALGIATPEVYKASDIEERGAYTANWESVIKADQYIVTNYKAHEFTETIENQIVFQDTFKEAFGEEGFDYAVHDGTTSFDGLTDVNGWYISGSGYVFSDTNMIGTWYDILYSPQLSLGSNNGTFTVSFTGASYGDVIVVQSGNEYQTAEFEYITDDYGMTIRTEKEITMTFNNGTKHHQLMFYTLYGEALFLKDFKITQNVTAGDMAFEYDQEAIVDGNETSYRFTGLENSEEYDYSYTVRAIRAYEGNTVISNFSRDIIVDLNTANNIIESKKENSIRANGDRIEVILNDVADIRVYTTTGMLVANINGKEGLNIIDNLNSGLYIVKTPTVNQKVLVK